MAQATGRLGVTLWNLALAISRRPLPRVIPRRDIFRAIRPLFLAIWQRCATRQDVAPWLSVLGLLSRLLDIGWLLILLLEYYPSLASSGALNADLAGRGLGERGKCPILTHVWALVVPEGLPARLKQFVPRDNFPVRALNPMTRLMVHSLHRDGFLSPCL